MELVFYVPGQPWVIDFAHQRGGLIVSQLENKTLDELQVLHPGAKIVTFHEAATQIHSAHRSQPRPIGVEDYKYARALVLDKVDGSQEEGESFKVQEFGTGVLAQVYARLGDCCWLFEDVHTLNHADILGRIREALVEL